jgi:hypothetical protein
VLGTESYQGTQVEFTALENSHRRVGGVKRMLW